MKIIDLSDHHKPTYFHCLEDWSPEMQESGEHKTLWFEQMQDKGLRVKLAVDEHDTVVGMIQYLPIEHSHVAGKNLYFIYCIWVHGHKQGIGNFQKKGYGTLLLDAAEKDALLSGAKGMVAWGLSLPFWMKASWFKKHGYEKVDKDGFTALMFKPFAKDVDAPRWIKQKKTPEILPGKVSITSFINGWCPAQNTAAERAKRASRDFGGKVMYREINTLDKNNFDEWGIVDALYIDDEQVRTGPAPSFEKIRKMIEKRVNKLK
jgi:hypothetical protein